MSVIVANCPRCGAERMTFDVTAQQFRGIDGAHWQIAFEVFACCRECERPSIFLLRLKEYDARDVFGRHQRNALVAYDNSLNAFFDIRRHISMRDEAISQPPPHLPDNIKAVFDEGSACLAIGCVNAAATMFRLCVDLATGPLLPVVVEGQQVEPPHRVRRDLGLRLPWLFDNRLLPNDLSELATAVKEDGNDGAHRASLSEEDALDLRDFTYALLDRLISEPARIREAAARRAERRAPRDQ